MHFKVFLSAILCTFIVTGCSSDNETFTTKIERFEYQHAFNQAQEAHDEAIKLAASSIPDVSLITYRDYPIPAYYRNLHISKGLSIDGLNYKEAEWIDNIKSELKESEMNPPSITEHYH